ncbi:hypothetical protein ACH5A7_02645 [Streptomyces sp. NPDC018955]
MTQAHLLPLMCGVVHAATVHPATDTDGRRAGARRYLTVVLEGLRTREG